MSHTMAGFVGARDAGKGYKMSGKRWLRSMHSESAVHLRALVTPSHSWMSPLCSQRICTMENICTVQETLESWLSYNCRSWTAVEM